MMSGVGGLDEFRQSILPVERRGQTECYDAVFAAEQVTVFDSDKRVSRRLTRADFRTVDLREDIRCGRGVLRSNSNQKDSPRRPTEQH